MSMNDKTISGTEYVIYLLFGEFVCIVIGGALTQAITSSWSESARTTFYVGFLVLVPLVAIFYLCKDATFRIRLILGHFLWIGISILSSIAPS